MISMQETLFKMQLQKLFVWMVRPFLLLLSLPSRSRISDENDQNAFYQMQNIANCEMSDSSEHNVMYTNFENSSSWNFYERFRLKRDIDEFECFSGEIAMCATFVLGGQFHKD